ncbi:hypothetical protein [Roseateles sp.]|uniref:hypothetical protein n=1 Tax=Roseateles sp. TaxID=1971397 RepID=UPI0031DF70FC
MSQVATHQPVAATAPDEPQSLLKQLVAAMPSKDGATAADVLLKKSVRHAITEIMTMEESLSALVRVMLDDSDSKTFALLEAMSACLQRMSRSIEEVDNSTFHWN